MRRVSRPALPPRRVARFARLARLARFPRVHGPYPRRTPREGAAPGLPASTLLRREQLGSAGAGPARPRPRGGARAATLRPTVGAGGRLDDTSPREAGADGLRRRLRDRGLRLRGERLRAAPDREGLSGDRARVRKA